MEKGHLEEILDGTVTGIEPVAGGCTNAVSKVGTEDGKLFLVKTQPQAPDGFACEAAGLRELASAQAVRTPRVVHVDPSCLVTEWIATGPRHPATFRTFGRQFARLHQHTSATWGFAHDNYCGQTPQKNTPPLTRASTRWIDFYFSYRLDFQMRLAERSGNADTALRRAYDRLSARRDEFVSEEDAAPSLLHGDLWSGNYLIDDQGEAVIIDPAVYYGHREADLAMTKLFGGFPAEFYEGYQEEYPLTKGWEARQLLYQLYHLLNHLNLMGGGYYGQALSAIQRLLGRFDSGSKDG